MTINSNEFSQMYTRLYKTVYYFALFKIKNEEDAKDIASEVFLVAFRSWQEMPANDETSRIFLFTIAKSRIIDYFRLQHTNFSVNSLKYKEFVNISEDEEVSIFEKYNSGEPLPEDYFEKSENKSLAVKMLNLLDESDRQMIISRYIEDMSYKEMSEIYEIKEQTARKRVERALIKIQDKIKVEKK